MVNELKEYFQSQGYDNAEVSTQVCKVLTRTGLTDDVETLTESFVRKVRRSSVNEFAGLNSAQLRSTPKRLY